MAIFYLFSNNHVNDIVALRFDFDDDEVLGYYINLLKTISLKLNESTVQFFFQASSMTGVLSCTLCCRTFLQIMKVLDDCYEISLGSAGPCRPLNLSL